MTAAPRSKPAEGPRTTGRDAALWTLVAAAILAYFAAFTEPIGAHDGAGSDGRIYVAMSLPTPGVDEAVLSEKIARRAPMTEYTDEERKAALGRYAPFCWRPLSPWLAALAGDAPRVPAFRWLGYAAHVASALLLWLLLAASAASRGARWFAGLTLLTAFGYFRWWAYLPAYTDPLTQTLWLLGVYWILRGRWWALVPLLALGALQKESLAILGPLAAWRRWRVAGWSDLPKAWLAAVLLVPAGVQLAVRASVQPINDYAGLATWWKMIRTYALEEGYAPKLFITSLAGPGALLPLVLCAPLVFWRVLREDPLWPALGLAGLALLFGGHDKTRLFLYLGPLLLLFAARWWDAPASPRGLWLAAVLAIFVVLHAQAGHLLDPWQAGHRWQELFPEVLKPPQALKRGREWARFFVPGIAALVVVHLAGSLRSRHAMARARDTIS